jgi:hypothetical protein
MDIFKEENNSISIALDRLSKAYLSNVARIVVHKVEEGEESALEQYIKAKGVADIAGEIMDGLKGLAMDEASAYSANDKVLGCEFQVKNTATTYDFSHDETWAHLNETMSSIKEAIKVREKQMLDAMKYAELVDENGEVIPPAVIKKAGGSTIAISIPKS